MSTEHYPHGGIIQSILTTELCQAFFGQFQILSQFHIGYFISNDREMSRKKRKGFYWGIILKEFRTSTHISTAKMADILGYKATGKGQPKGMISEIEQGKLPINEDKIRKWVQHCNKNMFDFYRLASEKELGIFLIDSAHLNNIQK